ncbi:MAG: hypothetical protein Q8764_02140 [Pigeon pea little leaf phytoplasma]|nr:hypothetical protein [Pigeon pea little leaf phytoplasma]
MIKRIVLPGTRLTTLIGRKKSVIYCLLNDIKENKDFFNLEYYLKLFIIEINIKINMG